ncbi:hypothetical protein ACQP00_04445 [Dactylosporangium sp. CS-047395]|uniref:hypothetical protein n=1 Tax=Dactylosporangium sp. CS-047395 TaxID=3239936 RepID=UPI003D89E102
MNDDEVEDRLRDALRQFAVAAPPGGAMLSTVTTESARRGRRTRMAARATGIVALVAIGAGLPYALRGGADDLSPVPAAPPGVGSSAAVADETDLVPSTVPASVTFPFAAPAGAGYGEPVVMLAAARPTLLQTLAAGEGVSVTLYSERPAPPTSKARADAAKIGGLPATVYQWSWSDDDATNPDSGVRASLVWQPSGSSWLRLDADSGVPLERLTDYAASLRPGLQKAAAPFTFKVMPAGWTVDNISGAVVTFAPPGVAPDQSFVDKIAVQLDETPGLEPKLAGPETVPVDVGGRKSWLTTTPEGQYLQIPAGDGHSVLLQIGARAVLPPDVLLLFAAGIVVNPSAQVSHG